MNDAELETVLQCLEQDAALWPDFNALCDCGGRRAGTYSERTALDFVRRRLEAIDRTNTRIETVPYAGWRNDRATLRLAHGGAALACNALLGTQPTPPGGLTAEVIDLGQGSSADFARHADAIRGRIVLVRHEYPFSPVHVHRRRKIAMAIEHGAAGFIIANPWAGGGLLAGSSGRGGGPGIPAVSTDFASAQRLSTGHSALQRVVLNVSGEDFEGTTDVVILNLPGRSGETVCLSAHVDGHDLAESAMDNGSGVAVALMLARTFAPIAKHALRGLHVCLFSAEEWALAGSKAWLARMPEAQRAAIALNVNLDTVAGGARLSALTSEFPALDAFVATAASTIGAELGTYQPLMANSDHYNFALNGIPALRLIAGFDDAACDVRHILSAGDTREKVSRPALVSAARAAAALLWRGMNAPAEEMAALRRR